ncbi:hypothetical protein BX600DRAFT_170462 [Xylariales sp. PMI_506]|nr:hypothetical protein BX600DRAFT_170462 [Xylariales sp. PMI_506]
MSAYQSGAATLPKGFRLDRDSFTTPEPFATGEEGDLPAAPRPRLRLKRRHVSEHLYAPTQQFLASVAAADVPLPSVEEPDVATADQEMMDNVPQIRVQEDDDDDGLDIYRHLRARPFSPPKTPAIDLSPSIPRSKFPNWSIESAWNSSDLESSPEYESSRPSTAFSTQTSSSLFSQFSHSSDDGECFSPELDKSDFHMVDLRRPDGKESRKRLPRKAPWTNAMSSHLWSVYLLYLQDPKVTPFRIGKSCIPPEGICARVAREAKRSWKGSKQTNTATRSGSSTPTAESSNPYIEWPHTHAATRTHLRELCRLKATSKHGRASYISQSPTPFNKAAHRRWNRRSTPARSPSIFSAQDMAMSLTLSTSEAMQPQGPLAQLASSPPLHPFPEFVDPFTEAPISPDFQGDNFCSDGSQIPDRARLGSPFLARSYGPSSSSSLGANIVTRRTSQTVGARNQLKSPARLTRSRSGTQKRRSLKALEEQQPRKRPSLAAALWGPLTNSGDARESTDDTSPKAQLVLDDSARVDNIFGLTSPVHDSLSRPVQEDNSTMIPSQELSLSTPPSALARLGSPFPMSHSSHSFPNRLSQPIHFHLSSLRRPFATVQQVSQISVSEAAPARSSLASRLAYIDQRLREFRNRGSARQRSQSPM